MDNNNCRAAQGQMAPGPPQGQVGGGEVTAVPSVTPPAAMDAGDWRTHLQADHRQRIVNKIMDTLKRHIPSSGPEGLEDLKKIAIRFEEKIYAAATSQTDYLRRISVKMLTMETKSQNPMASSLQPNAGKNPPEAVHGMQSQIQNQQLSMPVVSGQSQPRQQLIAQKMQANMMSSGVQSSAILTSAILNPVNLTQVAMPNVIGQNSNLQNMQSMPSIAQNPVGNSMGQGIPSNVFTNSQRLLPGRQQQVANQQQQQPQPPQQHNQNAQTFLYQQQFQNHQLMKQKLQQGGMAQSLMQQQNLLPPGQIQTSSQAVMQPSVMQSAPPSSLQQNKQSSVPQVTQPVLQPQSQSVVRQQQQPQHQASLVHQQQTSISQQTLLQAPPQPQQQQHQMIGQQSNAMSIQHNQLIGQPNCIQDAQQQQQRLLGQQSNIPNLQPQQLMGHQNSLSNMHQSQMGPQGNVSGLHQQSMLGNQSGNSGMPTNQHSMHMLQQSKVPVQQQMQQNAMTMLQSQNQLSQQQVSKQQMVSHIQSQPVPLQHLPPQSSLLRREVQQRLPTSGSLLQQQNVVEQQKQLFQSQRANPEASSISLDSTAQMGNINAGDWQEEVYQKIKSMKDMYFLDLNDLLMKIATKLQQHDFLPQQPRNEPLERLRYFKGGLERVVGFLRLNKNDVQIAHRDKLATVEKQIMNILNQNRPRRSASLQQGQPSQPQMPAVQHSQLQSQISQRPPQDNQMNSQMQPMNIQSSMTTMQQNNLTSIHHSSLSSVPLSSSQHNMMNSLQPSTSVDIGQSNALNPLQQTNSNLIQNQHIKQEQQTLPTQQLKQHMHQRQMQQMLARQQVMQQQQQQHQQQPQLQQQQVMQHHPSQLSGHGMSPSHQMSDSGDLKLRQQMGVKSAVFQQHHLNCQRAVYHHQLKSGSPFPVSPPQVLQAHAPQLPPHPSPQIDQQNMLISMAKAGTSLQSANSPFVSPSPSTPLAPSPMPGDSEKLNSSISSLPNVGNVGHSRVTTLTAAVQSLAIGTPGISASPLLAELSCLDGALVNGSTAVSCKSDVVEQPLEQLIKAVKSISHKTLTDSVGDISSVVSMVDRIAGSAPGNGWRAAVGEELVATTKCHLQARNFSTQDGPAAKRMRRFTSAMPSNVISSVSSVYLTVKQLNDSDAFELKSTAMSSIRRPKIEANHALVQEIREINRLLIETVLEISDDDVDPTAVAAAAEGCEGIIVKCSFSAVALGHLKSQYASAQTSPIQPLRLLIPTNYPDSSPILVDKFPIAVSKEYEYLSMKAKSSFSTSLRTLSQPMSLSDMAKTWDVCAHAVVSEFAQLSRGGTFSSTYGTWESCLTTF